MRGLFQGFKFEADLSLAFEEEILKIKLKINQYIQDFDPC